MVGMVGMVAAILLTAACSSGPSRPAASDGPRSPATPTPSTLAPSTSSPYASTAAPSPSGGSGRYRRYVALGDSYSAGPLIPTTALAGGCARSDHNYPSLVARRLGVRSLVDVTCSGATTRDLTRPQAGFGDARVPPQIEQVTRRTDLVTLGIGGNDLDLFTTLIGLCTRLRGSDPTGSPCAERIAARGPDLDRATGVISTRVAAVLREVRTRAPRARVLLVGYLRLVPDRGTCPALPLADGDYAEGRRISEALDRALADAARRTGVRFVDMYAASRGHDVCSASPWVNGRVTDRTKALAYHPLLAGMRADTARVLAALPPPNQPG